MPSDTVDNLDYVSVGDLVENLVALSTRGKNAFGLHKVKLVGDEGLRGLKAFAYLRHGLLA
jgi:hypothetical protein